MGTLEITIVGNGSLSPAAHQRIRNCAVVVRFNAPPQEHLQETTKTDFLYISNSSKQTQALISDSNYLNNPPFSTATTVVLPYDPRVIAAYMPKPSVISWLRGRRADLTEACISAARLMGKDCQLLTAEAYEQACQSLGIGHQEKRRIFPSSGVMAIQAMLNSHGAHTPIHLLGFGFQGWKHHDWASEKRYVDRLVQQGLARI